MMQVQAGKQLFSLRKAAEKDLDQVLQLLVGAAEWLQTKDTSQWDYYISDLEGNTEEVLESIQRQNTYILEKDGESAASVTLENHPNEWDCEIWAEEAERKDVIYLHRLVVKRSLSGNGVGNALMEWAKEEARRRDKKYIHFDCLASNKGLNNYYQRHYQLKGIANIYGQHSKYEIPV
ncbi:GNAT family N-acetyltransferase [Bacillus sp. AK031]